LGFGDSMTGFSLSLVLSVSVAGVGGRLSEVTVFLSNCDVRRSDHERDQVSNESAQSTPAMKADVLQGKGLAQVRGGCSPRACAGETNPPRAVAVA
jgi:hypothetical protein